MFNADNPASILVPMLALGIPAQAVIGGITYRWLGKEDT